MNAAQRDALAHFERFYPAFVEALDEQDAERVSHLVAEREEAVAELVAAFAGGALPEEVRTHIEGSEALVHVRLLRFKEQIFMRLVVERQRAYGAGRYQCFAEPSGAEEHR